MYLQGYGRMNGMGIVMAMPSAGYRSGSGIRPVTRAPIPSVNRPVVNTPTPVTQTVAVSAAQTPARTLLPVGPIYGTGIRVPPWLPAPRPTPQPPAQQQPAPPVAPAVNTNAGTPVPAGYPTSQMFVNTDGSFWQYSSAQSRWINVGTPYNTGASATPSAPPPSASGASTAAPTGTTAPPPVNVSVAPAGSSYQEILDWLQLDTLSSSIGFAGIPNWIVAGGGALLLYKVSSGGKR
jgi:hypothetical protein